MARPTKERRVEHIPEVKYFKPAGIPMREMEEINLTIEEIEAVRLKDKLGLTQEDSARRMNISRPTFQRVLIGAREKIAIALTEGKALRFQGGDYKLAERYRHCPRCGQRYEIPRRHRGNRFHNFKEDLCPDCD